MQEAGWFNIIMVYLIAWWFVLFMVLPFGAKAPEEVEKGHSTGAPQQANLGKKAVITTVLAAIVTWGFFLILESGIVPIRNVIH